VFLASFRVSRASGDDDDLRRPFVKRSLSHVKITVENTSARTSPRPGKQSAFRICGRAVRVYVSAQWSPGRRNKNRRRNKKKRVSSCPWHTHCTVPCEPTGDSRVSDVRVIDGPTTIVMAIRVEKSVDHHNVQRVHKHAYVRYIMLCPSRPCYLTRARARVSFGRSPEPVIPVDDLTPKNAARPRVFGHLRLCDGHRNESRVYRPELRPRNSKYERTCRPLRLAGDGCYVLPIRL